MRRCPLLMLSCAMIAAACLTCAAALAAPEVIELVPAVDERGAANSIERIDLRDAGPEEIVAAARGITTRLYGPRGPRNITTFVTDFAREGLLALDVRAASAGGADLAVHAGATWHAKQWRQGGGTIQVGRLFGVPVPAGPCEITCKAVTGTVVVDRYLVFADRTQADAREVVEMPSVETNLGRADGYRGIWYFNQRLDNEYVYKYSGGLGTYCAKHIPFAVYSPEANTTFFVYGGTAADERRLLIMASRYDHETGLVPRPSILIDKQTDDAHDNPVISLDDDGYVWVFASAHGTSRPSYIFRSRRPHSVDEFDLLEVTNFSYPQLHHLPESGFFFFQTLYQNGRMLHFQRSRDGIEWTEPERIAAIEKGHYQVSAHHGETVGTAFNYHPDPRGLNWRTNLYYLASDDLGGGWRTADGDPVQLPLTEVDNPALVRDYAAESLNVYMKDITFDREGRPIILVVTSPGFESGPQNDPRTWTTVHWTGEEWRYGEVTTSDNNYDTGSLYVGEDGAWTIIGPTEQGPQPYNPGGEMAMWRSEDAGATWTMVRRLTHDSEFNHTYARRPVNAHPGFIALWADGHGRQPSESRLYFADSTGKVWRLPEQMEGDYASPEPVG